MVGHAAKEYPRVSSIALRVTTFLRTDRPHSNYPFPSSLNSKRKQYFMASAFAATGCYRKFEAECSINDNLKSITFHSQVEVIYI